MSDWQGGAGHVLAGRVVRLDRHAALELLRRVAAVRGGMHDLRRLHAEELRSASMPAVRDEVVLAQLAEWLGSGALTASMLRAPDRAPAPHVETSMAAGKQAAGKQGAGKQAAAAAAAAAGEDKESKPSPAATLTNLRWSAPRVEVGAELDAVFTYAGFVGDKSATVKIFECNADGGRDPVGSVDTKLAAESGDHKLKWKRAPKAAQADLEEDKEQGDTGPLEYRFKVEAKGAGASGESGPLWLTNTVTVKLVKEEDGAKHEKARVVVLKDALGEERRTSSKDGEAKFEKVLVGPIEIRLAEPRFTGLAWSAPKVPVGKPAEAVFQYEDAIKGMKVSVVVQEFNADGVTTEVKRVEVELAAASGEAKASFTRTEDEAQEDIAADEREGDTGPVEYRYFVVTEDGDASEASGPLWLTHKVTLKLEGTGDGSPFEDGMELLLVGADGTEHRATLEGGEAKFEGVVCGPMLVKLAPTDEEGEGDAS